MSERSKETVLKTVEVRASAGSNPALPASRNPLESSGFLCYTVRWGSDAASGSHPACW